LDCFAVDEYTITEQHIRDARHGYYSAISYIDDKVGQLLRALKATGRDQDTIVIFTSDHGDMLGEHSLWYKMSWLEWSARVPLIVHAPHRFASKRVTAPVSLLDLLPTLIDLATDGQGITWAAPPDGDSLLGLLTGDSTSTAWDDRPVSGEYLAECVATPLLMIRQGRYKYICAEGDPDQLYDLAVDPNEVNNLAALTEYAALRQQFQQAVAQRWNIPQLRQQVIASQRQRRLVANALLQGQPTYWDFQPRRDASQEYVRNHMEFWELYKRTRFPSAEPPQPTRPVTRYANLPPTR
ncbi:MAG: sulfatase-like hydrolase/transferase, partial [Caldilineaceae bacterium]